MKTCVCGNQVSGTSCPKCGKTFFGKTILVAGAIVGLLVVIVALCNI